MPAQYGRREADCAIGTARQLVEPSYAATARDISLQDVDCTGIEHAAKVENVIPVLSSRNIHPSRCAVANQAQAVQVIGRDWLFEPRNAELRKSFRLAQGLLAAIRAIGVNVQFRAWSN